MPKKFSSGFTLIELLVVISLIGILTTLLIANLNTVRERGRDAQRKSDLRNMQTALRLYYNDKGLYPAASGTNFAGCDPGGDSTCSWGSPWSVGTVTYMSKIPTDPQSPTNQYQYSQTDSDTYILKACLENKSDDKCSAVPEEWCNTTLSGCIYTVQP